MEVSFPSKRVVLKRYLSLNLEVKRWALIGIAVTIVLSAVAPLALTYLFGTVIDGLLSNISADLLFTYLGIATIILIVGGGASIVSARLSAAIGYDLARQLSQRVYDAVLRLRMPTYATISQGVIISRLTNDIRMIEPLLVEVPLAVMKSWITLLGAAVLVCFVDPWFLIAFLVVPISLGFTRLSEKKIDDAIQQSFECSSAVSGIIEDTINPDAISLVRQSGKSLEESERFGEAIRSISEVSTQLFYWRLNIIAGYDICFSLISILILLIGTILVPLGGVTVGGVVSVIIYLRTVRQPLSALIGLRYPILRGNIGLQRLETVLRSPNANLPLVAHPARTDCRRSTVDPQTPVLEFIDVWYRYPSIQKISIDGLSNIDGAHTAAGMGENFVLTNLKRSVTENNPGVGADWVLKRISFSLYPGEALAISGPSGSGKTTILGLACGTLRPDKGQVKLNGMSTDEMSEEEILEHISLVGQDVYLRHDTLRNNLHYSANGSSDAQVEDACQKAGLSKTIALMPEGLDSNVGVKGKRLSGGERQRVSIARAILRDRPLILLDEATSNLDSKREREIMQEIDAIREEKGLLIVAHRLSALLAADKVLMLRNGQIEDSGSHSELLDRNEDYMQLRTREYRPVD